MVTKTPWHRDIAGGKSRSYIAPAAGSRPKTGEAPKKKVAQPSRRKGSK